MFSLNVKRLTGGASLPRLAHTGDLGYDLFSAEDAVIPSGVQHKVRTGVALQFPDGWGGIIKDRSSMASARVYSSAGVIDGGYRGEIMVLLRNDSDADYTIKKGDRVAQMVPVQAARMEVVEVEELSDTSRNEKGFGSSGK
ncbi:MAG: dUTP diphosphatase [Nitrospinota bacterium]